MSLKRGLETSTVSAAPPTKKRKLNGAVLLVKKLSNNGIIPTKGSKLAAGYDLYSAYDVTIEGNNKALIKTDIAIELPIGCYGRIAPRSGLAWKSHIDIGGGVIDGDYRGNIGVIMFNHSNNSFNVKQGMRIAQLILEKYEYNITLKQVSQLSNSERDKNGFGSTGVN